MNVGVILYCAAIGFLKTVYNLDEGRLNAFSNKLDMAEITERLQAFERICAGGRNGGTIGSLPIASRFRWLTATRSTVVQTSPVHPGRCTDAEGTITSLLNQLVLQK